MECSDLGNWAFDLQKTVYQVWKEKYAFWEPGFKVFYGPVRKSPEVMILSQNPGGGVDSFEREDLNRFRVGDFSPQQVHAYAGPQRLARSLQNLFGDKEDMLYESVTLPIIFFRSKNTRELSAIERFQYLEMERFSLAKVKEVIELVQPKKILVIGFKTHDLLERTLGLFDEEEFLHMKKGERLLAKVSKKSEIPIFSVIHLSGSRLNQAEKEFLKREFRKFLKR